MRSNQSFNNVNDKLNIDDKIKNQNYPLLSILNILFTSHNISSLLYEVIKISKEFHDSHITNIKYPQGNDIVFLKNIISTPRKKVVTLLIL